MLTSLFAKKNTIQKGELEDSIVDFSPVDDLKFKADKPIYYTINREMRFDESGSFSTDNKVIFTDNVNFDKEIKGCFVSPNGQFILIHQQECLFLLDNEGKKIDEIKSVTFSNPSKNKFDALTIEWSINSDFFCIHFYEKNSSSISKLKTTVFKYSVSDKKLSRFISFNSYVTKFHFHLTKDNSCIVFKPINCATYYKLDIIEEKEFDIVILNSSERKDSFYDFSMKAGNQIINPIFEIENCFPILFNNYQNIGTFQHGDCITQSYDLNKILVCDNEGLYLSKQYNIEKIFDIRCNNELRPYMSISLYGSYFLPNNKYVFIPNINSLEYTGSLILDTDTKKYARVPFELKTYYNINTLDFKNKLRYHNFAIIPPIDSSIYSLDSLETREKFINGEIIMETSEIEKPYIKHSIAEFKKRNRRLS